MTPAIELVVANAPDAVATLLPFLSAKIPTVSVPTWKHMYIPTQHVHSYAYAYLSHLTAHTQTHLHTLPSLAHARTDACRLGQGVVEMTSSAATPGTC